ncbi:HD domain-containing protein [Candidatus Sumerlaeota bacterium]|nr:HD domain-containing protein [Candidatus Sumerlaeota bacterium]
MPAASNKHTTSPAPRRPINAQELREHVAGQHAPYRLVTFDEVRKDAEVLSWIEAADRNLAAINFTDHGIRHISRVANRAVLICRDLELSDRERNLAGIAGYLHDIGNAVHRVAHAQSGAIMAYNILTRMNMDPLEIGIVIGAIGNHDEGTGEPINNPSAALILADKSDVLRSRVRSSTPMLTRDIHDRVNYAATDSQMHVDRAGHLITLNLTVDTRVSPVMEYFEIFLGRMAMCRRAANFLNCDFSLVINGTPLL